jgi:hypothetical protein
MVKYYKTNKITYVLTLDKLSKYLVTNTKS